jgi:acetyl-CoA acyltransferase 2
MKMELYVLAARRTPVGTFMGSLKHLSATELGVLAAQAAIGDSAVAPEDFGHSIFGNVCAVSSPEGIYLSRHIGLKAGLPQSIGALTVNRLCGSGFEALIQAQHYTSEGVCLVGGAENMSMTPLIIRNIREGFKFAKPPQTVDSLWESLTDALAGMPMGQTAELLAKEHGITREECDRWAVMSHQRAAAEADRGGMEKEIVPVALAGDKKLAADEHIRRDSSIEKLAKLSPVFGGVTTAANASGMNDAAAALVVCNREQLDRWMKKTGKKPMAKIVAAAVTGCDPKRMGLGPVASIQKVLKQTSWKMSDLDYLEINEAFAAQVLAVKKSLSVSDEQLNPHGSGISLGHPLGATGARISTHIVHLIQSGRATKAVGSACIGGGQGIAVAFEKF